MSNFDYMEYYANKAISDSEQQAIRDGYFHRLYPLFPDMEVHTEAIEAFSTFLCENFECVNAENSESLEALSEYLASAIAKYLDLRSLAGFELIVGENKDTLGKYFERMHGSFLMKFPESYEADE